MATEILVNDGGAPASEKWWSSKAMAWDDGNACWSVGMAQAWQHAADWEKQAWEQQASQHWQEEEAWGQQDEAQRPASAASSSKETWVGQANAAASQQDAASKQDAASSKDVAPLQPRGSIRESLENSQQK